MFVGYSTIQTRNTYKTYDPKTGRIHVSADIKWLNRMYFNNNRDDKEYTFKC